MTKVSVIIPVYNVESYLKETLDSLQNQTLKDIEIICVNDGSTDNSLQILEKYGKQDSRIKIFTQKNQGQSIARNKALEHVNGKYVYFLDGDDKLSENALQELYETCEKKNLEILFFSGQTFYDSKELENSRDDFKNRYIRKGNYTKVETGKNLIVKLHENGDYIVSNCIYFLKTSLLKDNNIKFIEEKLLHEDNLFVFTTLIHAKRTFVVKDIYFYRRVRQNSIMTTKTSHENLYGYLKCFIKSIELANQTHLNRQQENTINTQIFKNYAWQIRRIYNELDETEKALFYHKISGMEKQIFENICVKYLLKPIEILEQQLIDTTNRQIDLEHQLHSIKTSVSFKIGRTLTCLPRKTKTFIRLIKNKETENIKNILKEKLTPKNYLGKKDKQG